MFTNFITIRTQRVPKHGKFYVNQATMIYFSLFYFQKLQLCKRKEKQSVNFLVSEENERKTEEKN